MRNDTPKADRRVTRKAPTSVRRMDGSGRSVASPTTTYSVFTANGIPTAEKVRRHRQALPRCHPRLILPPIPHPSLLQPPARVATWTAATFLRRPKRKRSTMLIRPTHTGWTATTTTGERAKACPRNNPPNRKQMRSDQSGEARQPRELEGFDRAGVSIAF